MFIVSFVRSARRRRYLKRPSLTDQNVYCQFCKIPLHPPPPPNPPWIPQHVLLKIIFLFLNLNKLCGYSKEPFQREDSFEHPKHMFKLMGKNIMLILRNLFAKLDLFWRLKERNFPMSILGPNTDPYPIQK